MPPRASLARIVPNRWWCDPPGFASLLRRTRHRPGPAHVWSGKNHQAEKIRYPPGMPRIDLSPPATLPNAAKPVWVATVQALAAAGSLSADLAPQIERYAVAVARWREAEAKLAAEGIILTAPGSGVPMVNPWHGISRAAAAEAGRLERELGLTPLRRARTGRAARPLLANGRPAPVSEVERLLALAEVGEG